MRSWLVSFAFSFMLLGCGAGDPFDGLGGNDDGDGSPGGHIDASRCGDVDPSPERPRCVAPSGSPRVAVGLCGDLDADNTLTVETRASDDVSIFLAVDGSSRTASPIRVGGDWEAAGGLTSTNTSEVGGTLRVGADWAVSSPAHVAGDAFVVGSLAASNTVSIDGALHVSSSSNLDNVTAGQVVEEQVAFPSTLDCADAPDVKALVDGAVGRDDGGLSRHALENVTIPTDLTLGCGTYVLSSLEANNTLAIHVVGPTVLVVQGDFHVASPVSIDVDDDATLDLAIGGSLAIDNTLSIRALGDPSSVWVGVDAGIRVAAPFDLDGYLVAPDANLDANNTFDLEGSMLVRSLHVASPVVVHDGAWLSPDGCTSVE